MTLLSKVFRVFPLGKVGIEKFISKMMNREGSGSQEKRVLSGSGTKDEGGSVDDRVDPQPTTSSGTKKRSRSSIGDIDIGSRKGGGDGGDSHSDPSGMTKKVKTSTTAATGGGLQVEAKTGSPTSTKPAALNTMFKRGRHIDSSTLPPSRGSSSSETSTSAGTTQESVKGCTTDNPNATIAVSHDATSKRHAGDKQEEKEQHAAVAVKGVDEERAGSKSDNNDEAATSPKEEAGGDAATKQETSEGEGDNDEKEDEDRSSLLYTDNIAAACAATNEVASAASMNTAGVPSSNPPSRQLPWLLDQAILQQQAYYGSADGSNMTPEQIQRRLMLLSQQRQLEQLAGGGGAASRSSGQSTTSMVEMIELQRENAILRQHNTLLKQEVEELQFTLAQIVTTSFPRPEQRSLLLELFPKLQSILGGGTGAAATASTTSIGLSSLFSAGGLNLDTSNVASLLARRRQLQQQHDLDSALSDQLLGSQTAAAAAAALHNQGNPQYINALLSAQLPLSHATSAATTASAQASLPGQSSELQRFLASASSATGGTRAARALQEMEQEESKVQQSLLQLSDSQSAAGRSSSQQRDRSNTQK